MKSHKRTVRTRRRAFTLLEVLMVIVIIGILAAVVVPNFFGAGEGAKEDLTRSVVQSGLNGALEMFRMNVGRYPTTEEGLRALVEPPDDEEAAARWRGPYVKDPSTLKDAWGRDFIYESPGTYNEDGYDLSSPGRDGQPGTDDDITNWKRT